MSHPLPRTTLLAIGLALSVAPIGCRRLRGGGAPSPLPPPYEVFTPGGWQSRAGAVFEAPPQTSRPWRVMMLPTEPRPKKNPRWKPIRIEERGELVMPPGSHFRCLFNPASFRPSPDESGTRVAKWEVIRTVRCSADGWRTHSQIALSMAYGPKGEIGERSSEQAELYLGDVVAGKPSKVTIVLRPD